MVRCQYPVCHIHNINTEIQVFIMPMKYDIPKVLDINYNPVSKV